MILLSALGLIAGGGAGGYFVFGGSAVASGGAVSASAIKVKKTDEMRAQKARENAEDLRFVEMDPIILPIVDASGVSQVVTLVVSLEVLGDDNAKFAEKMTPRLKDAYIQHMYGVLSRKASTSGGMIKVDDLKARLNKVSSKVLGDDKINSVLLQVINQHPI